MAMSHAGNRLVVCAIDFGTTYSGYSFSFRDKPNNVNMNRAWAPGTSRLLSYKTPTCVLLNPQKKCVAFGFEAEDKYANLADEDKHTDWFFFTKFKMTLYDTKEISLTTLIEDIRGKRMEALTIFSHAIRYMVEHFRQTLHLQVGEVMDKDIQYVLTVPAIWSDKAKQFMREAANKAELPGHQLTIALEPEAASIWGQVVTENTNMNLSTTGVKYIIADLGGGTADITAHQKLEDGTLKELHQASGGPWGGTLVDQQYLAFLEHVCGPQVMKKFIDKNTSDYIDLLRDFEVKKRAVTSQSEDKITFRLPSSLRKVCKAISKTKLKELVDKSMYSSQVTVASEKIRVDVALFKEFFKPAIDGIMEHMEKLLQHQELRGIRLILLVGGFGECSLVQDAIMKRFPAMELIVPPDASLTVLKGAARFGHMRDIICSRKSKYAYGLEICKPFNDEIHPLDKKFVANGEDWCSDLFDKCVDVGEHLFPGKEVKRSRVPLNDDATARKIRVYYSERNDTRFVDDQGCNRLGHIWVPLPEGDTREDKAYTARLLFWGTEITVIVRMNKTGEEYETTVDCM